MHVAADVAREAAEDVRRARGHCDQRSRGAGHHRPRHDGGDGSRLRALADDRSDFVSHSVDLVVELEQQIVTDPRGVEGEDGIIFHVPGLMPGIDAKDGEDECRCCDEEGKDGEPVYRPDFLGPRRPFFQIAGPLTAVKKRVHLDRFPRPA